MDTSCGWFICFTSPFPFQKQEWVSETPSYPPRTCVWLHRNADVPQVSSARFSAVEEENNFQRDKYFFLGNGGLWNTGAAENDKEQECLINC